MKKRIEQPSYYSIIPASIRYDKDLTPNEKLMYGEITALSNKSGRSWATNNYFAELYDVHKKTVSRWISNLEAKGYIRIELEYKHNSKQVSRRYIYISAPPIHNIADRYAQKDVGGIHNNVEEELSTTSKNITSKNKEILSSSKEPDHIPYKKIVDHLNEIAGRQFRHTTNKTQRMIRARMNEGFNLEDFKKVIEIKVDEWSNDPEFNKYIRPETLFGPKFESYLNQPTESKGRDWETWDFMG